MSQNVLHLSINFKYLLKQKTKNTPRKACAGEAGPADDRKHEASDVYSRWTDKRSCYTDVERFSMYQSEWVESITPRVYNPLVL